MNLRWVIPIYNCNNMFLYEIIEDYKEASKEDQNEIFNAFCSSIWSSDNKRRTYTKTIRFQVKKDLLYTEIGQIFNSWSDIQYKYYRSMTTNDDWCSIIRQKINNIYTRYFDKDIILGKEYMNFLKTPKKLYYEWISGIDMSAEYVLNEIDNAVDNSEKVKVKLQREKMDLSWGQYKNITEGFLKRCFNNCKLISEYENKGMLSTYLDFITEDHFYVKYICKSLEGEIKKYQKRKYGLPQNSRKGYTRCKHCGALIEKTGNKKLYCDKCKRKRDLERYVKYNKKRITTNRKSKFSA